MEPVWDAEISQLLTDLSVVQHDLLSVLAEKRRCLAAYDTAGMTSLIPREAELTSRLDDCQTRRLDLLARAGNAGLPSRNLKSLTAALPPEQRQGLTRQTRETSLRARLLAHQGLANWVYVQRTLLHLSQLLEIIATGGRLQPTYGKDQSTQTAGSFLDQAA